MKGSCNIGAGGYWHHHVGVRQGGTVIRWQKNVRMAFTFNRDVWVDSFATIKLLYPKRRVVSRGFGDGFGYNP